MDSTTTTPASLPVLFTGSCFCKAVTFTLSSLPSKAYICHCLDCRRFTGSSFAYNAPFPKSALQLTFSPPQDVAFAAPPNQASVPFRTYDSQSQSGTQSTDNTQAGAAGKNVLCTFGTDETGTSKFCGICGTRLLLSTGSANEEMKDMVVVPVGVIDGSEADERLRPSAEGWCKRREGWMVNMSGTHVFDTW